MNKNERNASFGASGCTKYMYRARYITHVPVGFFGAKCYDVFWIIIRDAMTDKCVICYVLLPILLYSQSLFFLSTVFSSFSLVAFFLFFASQHLVLRESTHMFSNAHIFDFVFGFFFGFWSACWFRSYIFLVCPVANTAFLWHSMCLANNSTLETQLDALWYSTWFLSLVPCTCARISNKKQHKRQDKTKS